MQPAKEALQFVDVILSGHYSDEPVRSLDGRPTTPQSDHLLASIKVNRSKRSVRVPFLQPLGQTFDDFLPISRAKRQLQKKRKPNEKSHLRRFASGFH
jgi:hypothetical protein